MLGVLSTMNHRIPKGEITEIFYGESRAKGHLSFSGRAGGGATPPFLAWGDISFALSLYDKRLVFRKEI